MSATPNSAARPRSESRYRSPSRASTRGWVWPATTYSGAGSSTRSPGSASIPHSTPLPGPRSPQVSTTRRPDRLGARSGRPPAHAPCGMTTILRPSTWYPASSRWCPVLVIVHDIGEGRRCFQDVPLVRGRGGEHGVQHDDQWDPDPLEHLEYLVAVRTTETGVPGGTTCVRPGRCASTCGRGTKCPPPVDSRMLRSAKPRHRSRGGRQWTVPAEGRGTKPAFALIGLAAAVLARDLDGVLVEGDGPDAGGGLRGTFDDLVAGRGAVAADELEAVVEIHLGPAQPARLAAAQAAQSDEPPQREQAVRGRRIMLAAHLAGQPVTLRLDGHLMYVIAGGCSPRPCPPRSPRVSAAASREPASAAPPLPPPPSQPPRAVRRMPADGVMVARQRLRVGPVQASAFTRRSYGCDVSGSRLLPTRGGLRCRLDRR